MDIRSEKYHPQREEITDSKNMNINTIKKLIKIYVWSEVLHGCKTWITNTITIDMLNALEKWC